MTTKLTAFMFLLAGYGPQAVFASPAENAWSTLAGVRFYAEQTATDANGEVDLGRLDEEALTVLKDHLNSVKRLLTDRNDTYQDHLTYLEITGGNSALGRLAGNVRPARLFYSPFSLAATGADAAYDDLKEALYISSASAISGELDVTTSHEYLHFLVSRGLYAAPAFRAIFFVDQAGKTLREDAFYYATFLRADESLTHLLEIVCLKKDEAERRAEKVNALADVLTTLLSVTKKFAQSEKTSSPLRPGREVLAAGHLRLDLNGSDLRSLPEVRDFSAKLLPLAAAGNIQALIQEGKRRGLEKYCPGKIKF